MLGQRALGGITVCVMLSLFGYLCLNHWSDPPPGPPQIVEVTAGEAVPVVESGEGRNLLWPSEDFLTDRWMRQEVTIVPAAIRAPDQIGTADRIIAISANPTHRILGMVRDIHPGPYTLSVYAKPDEVDGLCFEMLDTLHGNAYGVTRFLMAPFGAITRYGDVVSAGIQRLPNGWYRLWAAMTYATSSADFNFCLVDRDQAASFPGNGTSGLFLWGAQFEPGKGPGPYTKTTDHSLAPSDPAR